MVALLPVPLSQNQVGREELRTKETELLSFSKLENPVGSHFNATFTAITAPLLIDFPQGLQPTEARLSILRYVIQATESGEFSDVPIDPMTGEPFMVLDKRETIEITSQYMVDGQPAVRYEVAKVVR